MWSGPCLGGPIHAQDGVSRYSSGFLLIDRVTNRVWIYDYVPFGESPTGGAFQIRIQDGEDLIQDWDAPRNRYRAAQEKEFEIRTLR